MIDPRLMPRLRCAFDGLLLADADGKDFYRMALEIDPDISPMEINDEITNARARWTGVSGGAE
ncbi:hypothetical protein LGH82_17650 [Mesorhizobium sp. PAMC28654]|uniref:hypothetical protein n=1 Tax=Mesorhizobium sp. PAMC28654 TaxID=2880934 RepID=UPI001D09EAB5|nr:hypothetical protein [Mesorhizobium sp. PAMC28654]UDL87043.1 hypothetical protein LGH82_17650 [Mesorhizobium sp. PAMC28654]